jgi:hypothetical protein
MESRRLWATCTVALASLAASAQAVAGPPTYPPPEPRAPSNASCVGQRVSYFVPLSGEPFGTFVSDGVQAIDKPGVTYVSIEAQDHDGCFE